MNLKRTPLVLVVIISFSLALAPAHGLPGYTPHRGDYFHYSETINLNDGTGTYYGYSEHETVSGMEGVNQNYGNGTISSNYTYSWYWSNSSGSTQSGTSKGNFTWSSRSPFVYQTGNDSQIGYVKPLYVWFYMDNTTQQGSTFWLLNTQMRVTSTNYSYPLTSYGNGSSGNVWSIRAQGTGGYQRNDVYGVFNANYTWTTYFDPSTGYIIAYDYIEQDTSSSASFTWNELLYVTSTSYPLTAAPPTPTNSGPSQLFFLIIGLLLIFAIIVIIAVVTFAVSRSRRRLPRHVYPQVPVAPPTVDLTPKQQPPVQQIVVKEIVKVKCRYCGALIDSTVQACPFCGAPRT
ncbi:zinc ribbon domain-containing protein [Candidatus Bathyarchaeota archaeon]|nr:zinc ribbon domain-containing protein [Candidatus Bathyarchaeota archaeon]